MTRDEKRQVIKSLLAGSLVGLGTGAGVSLANYLMQLRRGMKEPAPVRPTDQITVYLPPKGEKAGSSTAVALSILAALGGLVGTHQGVRELYTRLRKRQLEEDLNQAQQVYLKNLQESAPKEAAWDDKSSLLDKSLGIPLATWLGLAIASGVVTNKMLQNLHQEIESRQGMGFRPKSVVVKQLGEPASGTVETPEAVEKPAAITEDHLRHIIKTAITTDLHGVQSFNWLTRTGLLEGALACRLGADPAELVKGDIKSAAEAWLVAKKAATSEVVKLQEFPELALQDGETRKQLNRLACADLPKVATLIGTQFLQDFPIISKLAGTVDTEPFMELIPTFVQLDDAGCPMEKWADAVRNMLAAKAMYDTLIHPSELARTIEEKNQKMAVPEGEVEKVEKPKKVQITGKDQESQQFVNRNKGKIEKVIEKVEEDQGVKQAQELVLRGLNLTGEDIFWLTKGAGLGSFLNTARYLPKALWGSVSPLMKQLGTQTMARPGMQAAITGVKNFWARPGVQKSWKVLSHPGTQFAAATLGPMAYGAFKSPGQPQMEGMGGGMEGGGMPGGPMPASAFADPAAYARQFMPAPQQQQAMAAMPNAAPPGMLPPQANMSPPTAPGYAPLGSVAAYGQQLLRQA